MTLLLNAAGLLILALIVPFLWRALVGPTVFDRVQALNAMGTLLPVLFIVAGMLYGREDMFVDLALSLFLLNLFTTLMIARYVRHRRAGE